MNAGLKSGLLGLVLLSSYFLFSGCAQNETKQNVEKKLSQQAIQPEAKDKISRLIEEANITHEQREQLRGLHATTMKKFERLQEEAERLKSLLIEELLAEQYNAKEVLELRKRVVRLSDRRLALIFESIEKTNEILERNIEEKKRISPHMLDLPLLKF